MKTIKYKVYSVRLEDNNMEWLKKECAKYKSPNLFFRKLKEIYDNQRSKNNDIRKR